MESMEVIATTTFRSGLVKQYISLFELEWSKIICFPLTILEIMFPFFGPIWVGTFQNFPVKISCFGF